MAILLGVSVGVAWMALAIRYCQDLDRRLWPAVVLVCLVCFGGAIVVCQIRGFSANGTAAVLLTAPLVALTVTAGHPARMIDRKWLDADSDSGAADQEADDADRYGWRAVAVIVAVVIVFAIVDPSLLPH
jgi:hypothetical protein